MYTVNVIWLLVEDMDDFARLSAVMHFERIILLFYVFAM